MSDNWSAVATPGGWNLIVLPSVDSTNAWLKRHPNTPHGTVVLTENQTHGKGRRGSAWLTSPSESLAFSILLKPSLPKPLWSRFALVSGLAIVEGLASFGIDANIKWPNDIWIKERKVAGILIESVDNTAIIGIGLNVLQHQFPGELADKATSLSLHSDDHLTRAGVLEKCLASLAQHTSDITSRFPDQIERIRHHCALTGRDVSLQSHGQTHQGHVHGISDDGALIFEYPDGTMEHLIQADQIIPIDGSKSP